jgi:F-type H+-transporting ATPase subunit b
MSIVNRFDDLNTRRTEVEQSYKKYEEKLGHIDQEVQAILESAKAQGAIEKQKIIDEATRAAADIKRKAELAVQFEFSQAKQALRVEVAEQAASMAAVLVQKSFTDADQNKLVSEFLDKVGAR